MGDTNDSSKSDFYPSYAEFSKTLRTWFVAFGIGGPVVLLGNEKAWPNIVMSGLSHSIGALFLIGGGLQVVSALLNRHAMWHLYICEVLANDGEEIKEKKNKYKTKCIPKIAYWYSEQNWIDELLDLVTLVAFAWATLLTFNILSKLPGQYIYDVDRSWYAWHFGIGVVIIIFLVRLGFALNALRKT